MGTGIINQVLALASVRSSETFNNPEPELLEKRKETNTTHNTASKFQIHFRTRPSQDIANTGGRELRRKN
jgi:hypothetical protein